MYAFVYLMYNPRINKNNEQSLHLGDSGSIPAETKHSHGQHQQ